jgi:glucose/arabinose dehydrogenase
MRFAWAVTAVVWSNLACLERLSAGDAIGVERVARASTPMYVTFAPGDREHLFVAERSGVVRVLDLGTNEFLDEPLLDISDQTLLDGERGLLGLTFHPDFQENGQFFVHHSGAAIAGGYDHTAYIRRYEVSDDDPLVADHASETTILRFNQPQSNHNGGWIDFSPRDEFLYIATGDGGGANDAGSNHTPGTGNAQDVTENFLGKILRIDVDGDDFPSDTDRNYAVPEDNPFVGTGAGDEGDDEIFAYGLRNPFRDGFDRANGDLYIGDVGQNNWEEISFLPAGSGGGENFGWRLREGFHETPTPTSNPVGGPRPPGNVDPIHEYAHVGAPNGGNVVTGGAVYRGPVAELQGKYLFADFGSNQIWSFHYDGTEVDDLQNITAALNPTGNALNSIVAFGEDAIGNMYIVEIGGDIWRITGPAAAGDFNRDAIVDRSDGERLLEGLGTLTGASPATGDTDADGDVEGDDLLNYLLAFGTSALDVPAGSTAVGAAVAVPEPGAGWLACTVVVAAWLSRSAQSSRHAR